MNVKQIQEIIKQMKNQEIEEKVKEKKDRGFDVNEKGTILKTINNVEVILNKYNFEIYFCVVRKTKFIKTEEAETEIQDHHINYIYDKFQQMNVNFPHTILRQHINSIAYKNRRNQIKEYFESLEQSMGNDGNYNDNYIKELFDCLNVKKNIDFSFLLFKKWLIQCVRAIYNADVGNLANENVLILQGRQGARKTTFLRNLLPFSGFFKDGRTLDPSSKDSIINSIKYWIVELGEFDSTLKSDQGKLKQFLSETRDDIRLPYFAENSIFNRTTVFCASVNNAEFLKDESGSRRFWVIESGNDINIEKQSEIDLNKVWHEAYLLYKNELETHYLNPMQIKKLQENNSNYDVLDSLIMEFVGDNIFELHNKAIDELYTDFVNDTSSKISKIKFSKLIQKLYNVEVKQNRKGDGINKKRFMFKEDMGKNDIYFDKIQ